MGSTQMLNRAVEEYNYLRQSLIDQALITSEVFYSDVFRKYFLISCASLFENIVQSIISEYIANNTESEMIRSLVKMKVIERQYHTYFNWKDLSGNPFYSLFGEEFKARILRKISENPDLKRSERAFILIGQERNLMVHENFLGYQFNKTVEEIHQLYKAALVYTEFLRDEFGLQHP